MEIPIHVKRVIAKLLKSHRILIVSHHDADGASSAGVLYRALSKKDKEVDIVLIRQLYGETLTHLPLADYDFVLFTDLGGRYIDEILDYTRDFFVIDHHDHTDTSSPYLFHPLQLGYDPNIDASASTLSALIGHSLDKDMKTLVYGLVGAAGDNQIGSSGFSGLNSVVLLRGVKSSIITPYRDLVLPGLNVKELRWVLLYSEPPLPCLTGNDEHVYEFLERAGIPHNVLYTHLGLEEKRRFFTALALHLLRCGWPTGKIKRLIGEIYEINGNNGWLKTIRTFKSFINGVAKLLRSDLVGPLFLDDASVLPEAEQTYYTYKKTVFRALKWAKSHMKSMGSFVYVDGRDTLPEYVVGTVASVLATESGKVAVVVASAENKYVKGSIRGGANLSEVLESLKNRIDVEGGGHSGAAGFRIRDELLEDFLVALSERL